MYHEIWSICLVRLCKIGLLRIGFKRERETCTCDSPFYYEAYPDTSLAMQHIDGSMSSTCGVAEENGIPHLKTHTTVRYRKVRLKRDSVNGLQNFNVFHTILNICLLFPWLLLIFLVIFLRFTSACKNTRTIKRKTRPLNQRDIFYIFTYNF